MRAISYVLLGLVFAAVILAAAGIRVSQIHRAEHARGTGSHRGFAREVGTFDGDPLVGPGTAEPDSRFSRRDRGRHGTLRRPLRHVSRQRWKRQDRDGARPVSEGTRHAASATQDLSDGELFYVIEHGIRFTGMPGWGTGTAAGEQASWQLVHFMRHLPKLTPAELDAMKDRNPRSPQEIRLELEEERFLNEGAPQ